MQKAVLEQQSQTGSENNSLESQIGNTPLIRLRSITKDLSANIEDLRQSRIYESGRFGQRPCGISDDFGGRKIRTN